MGNGSGVEGNNGWRGRTMYSPAGVEIRKVSYSGADPGFKF